jgi:hypothetical protein
MTEEEFEQEVRFYEQMLVEIAPHADPHMYWMKEFPELFARFQALMQQDFVQFRRVCTTLLKEERYEVLLGTIKLLQSCKIRDSVLSMALLYIAAKQKDLREEALSALWGVRTLRVLPQIFLFAEKGYSSALYMIRHMLQTPEEIERGIALARKYIGAKDYGLREAALFLLQRYSSMDQEAERVLAAVQKYTDELFIDALKKAPPERVLEPLKALRSTIGANYAEYGDLSSTIQVLEQRKHAADEQMEAK